MHTILTSIQNYLKNSLQTPEFNHINVGLAPIKKDGQENDDEITITLLRIEEETSRKPQSVYHYVKEDDKLIKKTNPDVCLNLYILIVSHAQDYETALLEISKVIYWMNSFQSKDCIVELQTLSAEQNNSLWQTLGVEIKPAVVYKVRMVTISSESSSQPVYPVSSLSLTGSSGPWSSLLVKLHAGEGLSEEEQDDLRQEMVVRYAYPRMDMEIVDEEDDSEELKRRKSVLRQWMNEETWHESEIDRKDQSGEFVFPARIRDVKHQQLDSLIAALAEIYKKSPEERTPTETKALNRALEDSEIKEGIQNKLTY